MLKLENPPYDFDAERRRRLSANASRALQAVHIAELAIQQRLPTTFIFKTYVLAGGLISYGTSPRPFFASSVLT